MMALKKIEKEYRRVNEGKEVSSDELIPACAHTLLLSEVEAPFASLGICESVATGDMTGEAGFVIATFIAAATYCCTSLDGVSS